MKRLSLSLIAVSALVLAACETGNPVAPPAPTGLLLYSAISGTNLLPISGGTVITSPGQEYQFFARVELGSSDESDVSSYTQWSSSNDAVLTVSETGLVTTVGPGEAQVVGAFLDFTAATTFRIEN